jgi:hypothetical protein
VPLPNGETVPIEHILVDESRITLGMASCPSGKADLELPKVKEKAASSALSEMHQKAMNWAHQAKTAHLSPQDLHFSVKIKF